MIYDCFVFFNELDLLDLRLEELDPVVDRFVLVEATRTHQKKPKPLFFELNKQRYARYLSKIIPVVVDDYPSVLSKFLKTKKLQRVGSWDYENHQRNAIARGLMGCSADDTIMISDIDEIPSAQAVSAEVGRSGIRLFEQDSYYGYLNCRYVMGPENAYDKKRDGKMIWLGSIMLAYRDLTTPQDVRRHDFKAEEGWGRQVAQAGWHFSYLGGARKVGEKLAAFAHREFNTPALRDIGRIEGALRRGEDLLGRKDRKYEWVPIDETFPAAIRRDPERYAEYLRAAY